MKSAEQIERELKAPFDPSDIEWRVGSTTNDKTKGLALAYVTNRAIMNRLDDVFGISGWRNEFKDWKGNGVLCGISCKFKTGGKDDPYDYEWLTKWDGAEETNMEATKGGLSDAMKRAGYQWGIGRYLYKIESQWVKIEQRGKSYVIPNGFEPKLPAWALPDGYKYTQDKPKTQKKADEVTVSNINKNELISEADRQKLFALSKGKEDRARDIMTRYGFKASADITKEHYNNICDEIQAEGKTC